MRGSLIPIFSGHNYIRDETEVRIGGTVEPRTRQLVSIPRAFRYPLPSR